MDGALGGPTSGGGSMTWFSDPQRDSRDDIRAAQQALVYAGHSRSEAVAEYDTYLSRVRAALAAPRDVVWAGVLVAATMAVALTLALGVASFLIVVAIGPGVPVRGPAGYYVVRGAAGPGTADGPTTDPADTSRMSPLDILLPAVAAAAILSLAGAGSALVMRNRWRRAGALDTFLDLAPRRVYLLETVGVWLGVSGLIVAIVRVQAGPQIDDRAMAMLAFFGVPILAGVFSLVFPGIFNWLLPRISPLDAAAYTRPIIEREAALRIKSDRELYGRSVNRHSIDTRDRWADEVLARLNASSAARRRR